MSTDSTTSGNSGDKTVTTPGNSIEEKLKDREEKLKDLYASLSLTEQATDEQIQARYEQLKKMLQVFTLC